MKCPCEECISYVMCRIKFKITKDSIIKVSTIAKDCEILTDYLFRTSIRTTIGDKIRYARKVLGERI